MILQRFFRCTAPSSAATLGLLLVLLSTLFFAFFGAGSAFRSDEVWSINTTGLDYQKMMAAIRQDAHPPLYFQLLSAWRSVVGVSEHGVRGLSGLLYVLSVFAVYGLARKFHDAGTSILCACLYVTSPLAIIAAQLARMYALLSLLSILSTWFYLQFSAKPSNSKRAFLLYAGVNALGTFTHVWFFFLLFAQILCQIALFRHERLKRFLAAMSLSLLPYLLWWFPVLLRQLAHSDELVAWLARPGLEEIGSVLLLYGGALWLMAPVLLYGWWKLRARGAGSLSLVRANALPVFLLLASVGVPFLLSQIKPVFYSRFTIVGLHLYALAAGAVITAIMGRAKSRQLAVVLVIVTAAGMVAAELRSSECDSRWTAEYLLTHARDGDVVIFTSLSRLPTDYYLDKMGRDRELMETTFPAEIELHPGYEGRIHEPERVPSLRREAEALVWRIQQRQRSAADLRVFFLHGFRPDTDEILKGRLDEVFELVEPECVTCGMLRNYYGELSVYDGRKGAGR